MSGPLVGSAGARPRHPDRGARSAPGSSASRAPRSSRSSSPARATSCARSGRSSRPTSSTSRRPTAASTGYSLFWAVEGRGRKSITLDLRKPEGQDLFRASHATADAVVENFRPGTLEQWHIGPTDLDPKLVIVRISSFGQDGPYSKRPGLDRVGIGYGGLLNLTGYPDRPPVRVGVTISDYLTGVFAAQAAIGALYARDAHRIGQGRGDRRRRSTASVLRILEWTLPAYEKLGDPAVARGQPARQLGAARQLPHRRRQVRVHRRGQRRQLLPPVQGDGARRPARRPALHPARRPRRAQRRDQRDRRRVDVVAARRRRSRSAASRPTCRSRRPTPRPTSSPTRTSAARGDLVTVDDPSPGRCASRRRTRGWSASRSPVPSGAPRLGEHTDEVLAELLGLSPDDIDAATRRRSGVSVTRREPRPGRCTTGCSANGPTGRSCSSAATRRRAAGPTSRACRRARTRAPTTSRRSSCPTERDAVGLDRGDRPAAGLRRRDAVRVRRRRAHRRAARDHPPHRARPARACRSGSRCTSSPKCSRPTTTAPTVITYAFAPGAADGEAGA